MGPLSSPDGAVLEIIGNRKELKHSIGGELLRRKILLYLPYCPYFPFLLTLQSHILMRLSSVPRSPP